MTFYGHGIVWDKENHKRLCKFDNHSMFDTSDKAVCEKLISLGYKSEGELPTANEEVTTEETEIVEGAEEITEEEITEEVITAEEVKTEAPKKRGKKKK